MPRIVGIATALVWLVLLLTSFAFAGPEGAISFSSPSALIADAIMAAMLGIVVASVWFACRPRRWLAVLLFLISLVPAVLLVCTLWSHLSFFRTFGSGFFDALRFSRNDQLYLFGTVIFVVLSFLWALMSSRLRHVTPT